MTNPPNGMGGMAIVNLPTLPVGVFDTSAADWRTLFAQTALSGDRADKLKTSPSDLLSVALALTPTTPQPDPPVSLPFRFGFPSHQLLRGGAVGAVTSEVLVFQKLAAHNVLVELWNSVAATRSKTPFPQNLIQKPLIQALSQFYRLWHGIGLDTDSALAPDFRRGPLSRCAERCVWSLLHFAVLGVSTTWREEGSADNLQSRLVRTAKLSEELQGVFNTRGVSDSLNKFAKTLDTQARHMFIDTLVCKIMRFGTWHDSVTTVLSPSEQAQILVRAADSITLRPALSDNTQYLLVKTASALRSFVRTQVSPARNLEFVVSRNFPSSSSVFGSFEPLPIETQTESKDDADWWWGERVHL